MIKLIYNKRLPNGAIIIEHTDGIKIAGNEIIVTKCVIKRDFDTNTMTYFRCPVNVTYLSVSFCCKSEGLARELFNRILEARRIDILPENQVSYHSIDIDIDRYLVWEEEDNEHIF